MTKPLIPETARMLETIAKSAGATDAEMLNALVHYAYYQPHAEWEMLLKAFRDRPRGDRHE